MSDLKATISNIQRFSTEDGPGIRTTIFFKGCPLRCPWCHNPEGLSPSRQLAFHPSRCIDCGECADACDIGAPLPGTDPNCKACGKCADACPTGAREIIGREVAVDKLFDEIKRDIAFYGDEGGITASGGEASLYDEFTAALFEKCRRENIHTALDTCGATASQKLDRILEHSDMVLFDLKIMNAEKHRELIGYPLAPILENLKRISETGKPVWIRFPFVPGYTDGDENIEKIIGLIENTPNVERIDILAFHQLGKHKYGEMGMPYMLADLEPPPDEAVEKIKSFFRKRGLPVPDEKV